MAKKKADNVQIALHMLEQANKIYAMEKLQLQMNQATADLVNNINKVNIEISKRIENLERRICEVERLSVKEPTTIMASIIPPEDDFN